MTVAEALRKVIAEGGKELLLDRQRFYAYLLDYADRYDRDFRLFAVANANGASEKVYSIVFADEADRAELFEKGVRELTERALMSEGNARRAMELISYGAGVCDTPPADTDTAEECCRKAHGLIISGNNLALGVELLAASAEAGNGYACFALGACYRYGLGVGADNALAYKWLSLGAEKGNHGACLLLGDLYKEGVHVPRDEKKAAEYYKKAADMGCGEAENALSAIKTTDKF